MSQPVHVEPFSEVTYAVTERSIDRVDPRYMYFVRASTSGGGVGSDGCTPAAPGETRFWE